VQDPDPAGGHSFPVVIGGGRKQGRATVICIEADDKGLRLEMIRDDGEVVGKYDKRP